MSDYPRVTSVLGVLRKEGLERWFKNNTAEFCDVESKKGKEIGTIIHKAIQNNIEQNSVQIETEYPNEVQNALKSFFKFKKENPELKLKKAEMSVISEKHGYLGTLDCIGSVGNKLVIIDWKTGTCNVGKVSKGGYSKEVDIPPTYPEHEYQVCAYVKAYNETENKEVSECKVLVLAKDKVSYNLLGIGSKKIDEIFENVFLPCLSIYKHQLKEGLYDKWSPGSGGNTRQRDNGNSEKGGKHSSKSAGLPASF